MTRVCRVAMLALALVVAWQHALPPAGAQAPSAPTASALWMRVIIVPSVDDARAVIARVRAGESFEALARQLSLDPSAPQGGLVGPFEPAMLRPEMRDALVALAPGAISEPVPVPAGVAVLQRLDPDARASSSAEAPNPGLAATGSVKFVVTVAGLIESLASLERVTKPDRWNEDPRTICTVRTEAGRAGIAALEASLGRPMDPVARMKAHFTLGQFHAYSGRMDQAIDQFQRAYTVVETHNGPTDDAALQLDEVLGVAWLHKAEMDNGLHHAPGERCLLSPAGLTPLAQPAAAERAVTHFLRYLHHRPDELEVKWLLNLASMSAGAYPHRVPPAHLIPPETFASGESTGRFIDVASAAGLDSVAMAGGLLVDDFDNDGRLDVVTSSMDSCAPMRMFTRRDDGRFAEGADRAGLAAQLGGLNLTHADYDNDGCTDILVLRGGWEFPQRKSLLRNNCNGTFSDVTVAAGVAQPLTSTQTAVWTDVDNDGFLDLLVGNEAAEPQLYMNQRNGTFKDVATPAGLGRVAFTKGVAALDYDNDGWQDLYLSNLSGDSFLYRNNRDGTFTEVGRAAGAPGSQKGFATWSFDYDNDGWQDLFVTSYFTSVEETARTYLARPNNATTLKLYRNTGKGGFEDVTRAVGLDKVFMPMGANFGDIDGDGFLDIYLGTGNPSYAALVPSVLLRNRDGQSFVDVTAAAGVGELHKGHGVAFADLDHDGSQDLVFEVGGAVPGDAHALRLFRNPGHGQDWLGLRLVGVKSNRSAIGARITVTVERAGQAHRFHRTVSTGGSFGGSPLMQQVGLGRADRIVDVRVWWPTSQTHQIFRDVPKNRVLEIRELADAVTVLERPPLPLGGTGSAVPTRTK